RLGFPDVGNPAQDVEVDAPEELLIRGGARGPDPGVVPRLPDHLVDERLPDLRARRHGPLALLSSRDSTRSQTRRGPCGQDAQRPRAGPGHSLETERIHRPTPGDAPTPKVINSGGENVLDAWKRLLSLYASQAG